jgi:hypothetical protein
LNREVGVGKSLHVLSVGVGIQLAGQIAPGRQSKPGSVIAGVGEGEVLVVTQLSPVGRQDTSPCGGQDASPPGGQLGSSANDRQDPS